MEYHKKPWGIKHAFYTILFTIGIIYTGFILEPYLTHDKGTKMFENKPGLEILENLNIITNKEVAYRDTELLVSLSHEFISKLTHAITPEDYKSAPHEFIEMILATMAYTSAELIGALYDMFPAVTIDLLKTHFNKSHDFSIAKVIGLP